MDEVRGKLTAAVVWLVLLAGIVQVWTIRHATVPALDAVRFVAAAQQMDRTGVFGEWIHGTDQPLYPTLVLLAHHALTATGLSAATDWATAAQVAAAVPFVLAVVPLCAFMRRLVGRDAAVAGGMYLCVLPEISRLGSAGLSDSTHLLLVAVALWAASRFFAPEDEPVQHDASPASGGIPGCGSMGPGHWGWLLASGVAAGTAALARAEALVIPPAVIVALLSLNHLARRNRAGTPWSSRKAATAAAAAHLVGVTLVIGPYLVANGAFAPRDAMARLLGRASPDTVAVLNAPPGRIAAAPTSLSEEWRLSTGERMTFGRKDPSTSDRFHGPAAAASEFAAEASQAFQYWIGLLALIGLWRARRRTHRPLDRFLWVLAGLFVAGVFFAALTRGYLASRHLALLVIVGLGWSGYGSFELGRMAIAALGRGASGRRGLIRSPRPEYAVAFAAAVLCVPRTMGPLNSHDMAHRAAARWLAEHAIRDGMVLDTHGLTALYTGCPTYQYEEADVAYADPRLQFVVIERGELRFESGRARTLHELLEAAATERARFKPDGKGEEVSVYRWYPERFRRYLACTGLKAGSGASSLHQEQFVANWSRGECQESHSAPGSGAPAERRAADAGGDPPNCPAIGKPAFRGEETNYAR